MPFSIPTGRPAVRRTHTCHPREDDLRRSEPQRKREAFFPRGAAPLVFFVLCLFLASSSWAYTFQSTGLYQSYNDLAAWANNLQAQNPNLVKVVQYGTSYLGNPLIAVEITANVTVNDPTKSDFLFTAGIHAREVIASQADLGIAQNLVSGYTSTDPTVQSAYQSMLAHREVWIIPQQNPDGRLAVEAGQSYQRKNMDPYPGQTQTTTGVDLNRNFPHLWNLASSSVTDETYRGPSVLSEPESAALWNFVHNKTEFSNLLCSVDFHSGAQTILTPWVSPDDYAQNETQIPQAVQNKFNSLAAAMSQKTGLSTARLSYDSYGTESDSLYAEFGSYSMTEELYTGSYIGSYPDYYFSYFNPVDAATRDATVQKAVDSALYLLSDAAFTVVPEPSSFVMLAAAVLALIAFGRRRRQG